MERNDKLTLAAICPVVSGLALTLPQHTLALSATPFGTIFRQLGGHLGRERNFLALAVVVVNGDEPVAGVEVIVGCASNRWLKDNRKCDGRGGLDFGSSKSLTSDLVVLGF